MIPEPLPPCSLPSDAQKAPSFASMARFDPDLSPARRAAVIGEVVQPRAKESDPVAYLLGIMDTEADPDYSPEQRLFHDAMRLKAAIAAAPFIRPKLAQVEVSGKMTISHEDALAELESD